MPLISILLASLAGLSAAVQVTPLPDGDEHAEALKAIHSAFLQLGNTPTVGELVRLDGEIRALREAVSNIEQNVFGPFYFREEYAVLGLSANFWSGTLEYDGKLLNRAHAINPHSEFRNRTLYSQIEIGYWREGLPGVASAHQYATEFPDGPFIFEVYETLATFYDDLYKCVRYKVAPLKEDSSLYRMECYEPYFSSIPLDQQMLQYQALAAVFYAQALALLDDDSEKSAELRAQCEALRRGSTKDFYWCVGC